MKTSIFTTYLNTGLLSCLFIFFSLGCTEDEDVDAVSAIPVNSEYNIIINGEGYVGGFVGSFQIPARLVVVATIPDNTQNNGVNPVDVGIFTNPGPIVGQAGALYFGTNTSLSSIVGSTLGASAIDVAIVGVNQASRTVSIEVDGNAFGLPTARLNTFNIYNLTTGITAQIHNVLAGRIEMSFNGNEVQGTIQIGGSSGFTGPGITSNYIAGFTGTRSN